MTRNDIENYVIENLIIFKFEEQQIADVILHLRNLELPLILVEFLRSEGDFLWYLLNTYEFMVTQLRNKGIALENYYSINKHPKSNFHVYSCSFPQELKTAEQKMTYWTTLKNQYEAIIKDIT